MKRIILSKDELKRALRVWMAVAPTRLWRELEKQDLQELNKPGTIMDPEAMFKARHAMADYVAGKFDEAGWEVSHEERKGHG